MCLIVCVYGCVLRVVLLECLDVCVYACVRDFVVAGFGVCGVACVVLFDCACMAVRMFCVVVLNIVMLCDCGALLVCGCGELP